MYFCASFPAQTKKERGAASGLTHGAAWVVEHVLFIPAAADRQPGMKARVRRQPRPIASTETHPQPSVFLQSLAHSVLHLYHPVLIPQPFLSLEHTQHAVLYATGAKDSASGPNMKGPSTARATLSYTPNSHRR